jgi:hypothetical protein
VCITKYIGICIRVWDKLIKKVRRRGQVIEIMRKYGRESGSKEERGMEGRWKI